MNDSSNHQLEWGKREELGGANQAKATHTPPDSPSRPEAQGGTPRGGAPKVSEPGGWMPGQLLEGWGGVVSEPPPSFPWPAQRPLALAPPPPPFPTPLSGVAHAASPCCIPPSLRRAGTGPCSPQPMAGQ